MRSKQPRRAGGNHSRGSHWPKHRSQKRSSMNVRCALNIFELLEYAQFVKKKTEEKIENSSMVWFSHILSLRQNKLILHVAVDFEMELPPVTLCQAFDPCFDAFFGLKQLTSGAGGIGPGRVVVQYIPIFPNSRRQNSHDFAALLYTSPLAWLVGETACTRIVPEQNAGVTHVGQLNTGGYNWARLNETQTIQEKWDLPKK